MTKKKRLCVFCGAVAPAEHYVKVTNELGERIASSSSWELVYGGTSDGLMTVLADAVLKNGGNAYGVIPDNLIEGEHAHTSLTELFIVKDIHERKRKMYDMADAFLALPGGYGTLDELCETLTWAKLKYHKKPIFILNHRGFFNHLLEHFKFIEKEGLIKKEHLAFARVVNSVDELFVSLKDD